MRIMAIPTKMGGYFIGLIFLIYILAIGYSNNLLLIFCLVLFSLNFIWFLTTLRYALNLKLHFSQIRSNYAGEDFEVSLDLNEELDSIHDLGISFRDSLNQTFKVKIINHDGKRIIGRTNTLPRGVYDWRVIILKVSAPLGLYQITRKVQVSHSTFSYPQLIKNFDLRPEEVQGDGVELMSGQGSGDFFGLNAYDNESARKISWKHYAQTGSLFLKEFENNKTAKIFIELNLPEKSELKESYLSTISSQLTETQRLNIPFEFKFHDFKTNQLSDALKELAKC